MRIKNFLLSLILLVSTASNSFIICAGQSKASVATDREQSPTHRFLTEHPFEDIIKELNKFNYSKKDEALFNKLIEQENSCFIGYHASSSDFRIFQDVIRLTIEEIMNISLPSNFHFFRNPLDKNLIYETAEAFTEAMPIPKSGKDSSPEIRVHILSLNIALYQSFDTTGSSTPRHYLDNNTRTNPPYQDALKSFFSEIGLDPKSVPSLYTKAKKVLPTDRGVIYQFFVKDEEYSSINTYFYVAKQGGAQIPGYTPTDVLFDYNIHTFPQMRMIFNVKSTLNPYHKIEIRRFDNLSKKQKKKYEDLLLEELKKLPIESAKLLKAKNKLTRAWKL